MNDQLFFFDILTDEDKQIISEFPNYDHPYEILDYALRKPNGWLYTILPQNSEAIAFTVKRNNTNEIIGFVLLDINKEKSEADAYIALHKSYIGRGRFGYKICLEGLKKAFVDLNLSKVTLSLRLNHKAGYKLYTYIGFKKLGIISKTYNDIQTDFYYMEMSKEDYLNKYK
jgi:RimJ/RimL family protein N-acetyltransferase